MSTRFRSLAPIILGYAFAVLAPQFAFADDIGCVTTAWKLIGANHKVCVSGFTDPRIPGVACYISQARAGGISGGLGLAEDPSQFSIACRQIGPITLPDKLPEQEDVFTEKTSIFFKSTNIKRMYDRTRNVLVYLAISRKIIEGAPANSVSAVAIQPWTSAQ